MFVNYEHEKSENILTRDCPFWWKLFFQSRLHAGKYVKLAEVLWLKLAKIKADVNESVTWHVKSIEFDNFDLCVQQRVRGKSEHGDKKPATSRVTFHMFKAADKSVGRSDSYRWVLNYQHNRQKKTFQLRCFAFRKTFQFSLNVNSN